MVSSWLASTQCSLLITELRRAGLMDVRAARYLHGQENERVLSAGQNQVAVVVVCLRSSAATYRHLPLRPSLLQPLAVRARFPSAGPSRLAPSQGPSR